MAKRPKSKASLSKEDFHNFERIMREYDEKKARGEWTRNSYRAPFDKDDPENWSSLEMLIVEEIDRLNGAKPEDRSETSAGDGIVHFASIPSGNLAPKVIKEFGPVFGTLKAICAKSAAILQKNGYNGPPQSPSPWTIGSEVWLANELLRAYEDLLRAAHRDWPMAMVGIAYRIGLYYGVMDIKAAWERDALAGEKSRTAGATARKKAVDPAAVMNRWHEIRVRHPNWSGRQCDEEAGRTFGLKWRTVYGYRNPRK